jgi:hypothetical protein
MVGSPRHHFEIKEYEMSENTLSKETNEERRARRLRREITKNHNWRVSTWAKAERYIEERQQELESLGFDRESLFEPDFKNAAMLEQYADLPRSE